MHDKFRGSSIPTRDYLSIDEATRILNCTEDDIFFYAESGMIRLLYRPPGLKKRYYLQQHAVLKLSQEGSAVFPDDFDAEDLLTEFEALFDMAQKEVPIRHIFIPSICLKKCLSASLNNEDNLVDIGHGAKQSYLDEAKATLNPDREAEQQNPKERHPCDDHPSDQSKAASTLARSSNRTKKDKYERAKEQIRVWLRNGEEFRPPQYADKILRIEEFSELNRDTLIAKAKEVLSEEEREDLYSKKGGRPRKAKT